MFTVHDIPDKDDERREAALDTGEPPNRSRFTSDQLATMDGFLDRLYADIGTARRLFANDDVIPLERAYRRLQQEVSRRKTNSK